MQRMTAEREVRQLRSELDTLKQKDLICSKQLEENLKQEKEKLKELKESMK